MTVKKVLKVYFDYANYINPAEIISVFELYHKYRNASDYDRPQALENLELVLRVITKDGEYSYNMDEWVNSKNKKVVILQILDEVTESMFTVGQDDIKL